MPRLGLPRLVTGTRITVASEHTGGHKATYNFQPDVIALLSLILFQFFPGNISKYLLYESGKSLFKIKL